MINPNKFMNRIKNTVKRKMRKMFKKPGSLMPLRKLRKPIAFLPSTSLKP
jgi:hypothetical protein